MRDKSGREDGEMTGCGGERQKRKRVKRWREECDKEAFEGSSQMQPLLSSAPSEPLRYLNPACLSSTSL
ncbi:hypothetical protein PBY51_019500 [Eleginops maclovinus]|uniref:Uncharacterized protein n=1 Tax=Eleginops maclovinus TaxID=56733 RepID=A0AAN7YDM0_ELEMC|nr:hypothetical protein PBY51_019500 [Eleginops maclovinus]